jgi:hypothetical protein
MAHMVSSISVRAPGAYSSGQICIAVGWCWPALGSPVCAFAAEHIDWLAEVREAIAQVDQVRARLKLTRRAGAPAVVEPEDL